MIDDLFTMRFGDFGNFDNAIEAREFEIMSDRDSLFIKPPVILA